MTKALKKLALSADMGPTAESGGSILAGRPSRFVIAGEFIALGGAVAVGFLTRDIGSWSLSLFVALLTFSVIADLTAAAQEAKIAISGSFLSLVLAMVFLSGSAAALIGTIAIVAGWLQSRYSLDGFLNNVLAYAWFPLLGGLAFAGARDASGLTSSDGFFYLLVFGVFVLALVMNFLVIAGYSCYLEGTSLLDKTRKLVVPILSSELFAALLAVGVAFLYHRVGLAAIGLFGLVLFTFQYLLGQLLVSEERAGELQVRTQELASLQVGVMSALLQTLDLRDRMTARHSAAVARYSREIAREAGFSEEEQELVHTAALLHDIGKFTFPDRILDGDSELSEEDRKIIRKHPFQGAKVVSQVEGYGPVGEIILAHHERIDGQGYPRGLSGEEIPPLSRIISVADVYDVMTARDSYRKPVSSFEAIHELRRVGDKQVDSRFTEVFVRILEGKDLRYRHGENADFDEELALEARVSEYASPDGHALARVPGATAHGDREAEPEGDGEAETQEAEPAVARPSRPSPAHGRRAGAPSRWRERTRA